MRKALFRRDPAPVVSLQRYSLHSARLQYPKYSASPTSAPPGFLWWIGDTYAANYGPKRGQSLEPLKTLKLAVFSGQAGQTSSSPRLPPATACGLRQRQTAKGTYGLHPFGMAEAVDMHTALRSYTAWGSRQMFLENKIGSLEVGKKADIAIWDRDLYAIPIDEVKNLKCLMTLFDGEVVYSSPDSSVITPAH